MLKPGTNKACSTTEALSKPEVVDEEGIAYLKTLIVKLSSENYDTVESMLSNDLEILEREIYLLSIILMIPPNAVTNMVEDNSIFILRENYSDSILPSLCQ